MTDQELLRRYQEGDVSAFKAVLERYERPLLRYVARYQPGAAQDLVQEVFLRLVREVRRHGSGGGLDGVGNLQAWLYRVARNLAIDEARKEERMERRHRLAAVSEVQPPPVAAETQETAELVAAKLLDLPSRERDVLILKIQEKKSYREISEITGLSTSNVGYLVHQGLKTLAGDLRSAGIV